MTPTLKKCPECKSKKLEWTVGCTFNMFPALYPIKCTKCDWSGKSATEEEWEEAKKISIREKERK